MGCSYMNTGLLFVYISSRVVLILVFPDSGLSTGRTIILLFAKTLSRVSRTTTYRVKGDYRIDLQ